MARKNNMIVILSSSDEEGEAVDPPVVKMISFCDKLMKKGNSPVPAKLALTTVSSSQVVSSSPWISKQSTVPPNNPQSLMNSTIYSSTTKTTSKQKPLNNGNIANVLLSHTSVNSQSEKSLELELNRIEEIASADLAQLSKGIPSSTHSVGSKIDIFDENVRRQIESVKEQLKLKKKNVNKCTGVSNLIVQTAGEDSIKVLEAVCLDKLDLHTLQYGIQQSHDGGKPKENQKKPKQSALQRVFSSIKTLTPLSSSPSQLPGNLPSATSPESAPANVAKTKIPETVSSISASTLTTSNVSSSPLVSPTPSNYTPSPKSIIFPAKAIRVTDLQKSRLYCSTVKAVSKLSNMENTKIYNSSKTGTDKPSVNPNTPTPIGNADKVFANKLVAAKADIIILDSDDGDEDDTNHGKQKVTIKQNMPATPLKSLHEPKRCLENVVGKLLTHSTGKQSVVMVQSTASPVRNTFLKQSPNTKLIQQQQQQQHRQQQILKVAKKLNLQSKQEQQSVKATQKQSDIPQTPHVQHSQQPSCSRTTVDTVIIIDDGQPEKPKHPKPKPEKKKMSKKMKIRMLVKKLEYLEKEIAKYASQELSTNDMEHEESAYIQESKLKEDYVKHWRRYCLLIGDDPDYYISSRKKIKLDSTPFPELNREVERLVNCKSSFPNLFEIKTVCKQANEKYQLQLKDVDLNGCAVDLFTESGKKVQDRRKKEFRKRMFAEEDISKDPAISDKDLQRKFKTNRKIAKKNTDEVFADFVRQQTLQETFVNDDEGETSGSEDYGDTHIESLRKRNLIENNQLKRKLVNQKGKSCGPSSKKVKRATDSTTVINVTLSSSPNHHIQQPGKQIDCRVTVNSNPASPKQPKSIKPNINQKIGVSSSSTTSEILPIKATSSQGKPTSANKNTPNRYTVSSTSHENPTNNSKTQKERPIISVQSATKKTVTSSTTTVRPSPASIYRPLPAKTLSETTSHENISSQAQRYKGFSLKSATTGTPILKGNTSSAKRTILEKPVLGLDTLEPSTANATYKSLLPRFYNGASSSPQNAANIKPIVGSVKTEKKSSGSKRKAHDVVIID